MNVEIGGRQVDQFTDSELAAWLNEVTDGYKLREDTVRLWIAILRAFDEAGPPMTVRQMYYAIVSAGAILKPKVTERMDTWTGNPFRPHPCCRTFSYGLCTQPKLATASSVSTWLIRRNITKYKTMKHLTDM